jgi:hypothetical protein
MTADRNKDVVRRFMTEVLSGGQLDRVDELLAPNYVNRAFGADLPAFKEMLAGLAAALPERRFDVLILIGCHRATPSARRTRQENDPIPIDAPARSFVLTLAEGDACGCPRADRCDAHAA